MPWSALAALSPARMDAGTPFGQAAHRSRRPRPSRNSMPLVINLSKGATFRLLNGLGHGGWGVWGFRGEATQPPDSVALQVWPSSSGCAFDGVADGARPSPTVPDRKSTRLNSSHRCISYAVFCLK